MRLTPELAGATVNTVPGAGIPTQVRPPSLVGTTEVHGGLAHGAVPKAHPLRSDTNVTEIAEKRFGTRPPAGPDAITVVGVPGATVVEGEVSEPVDAGGAGAMVLRGGAISFPQFGRGHDG